MKKVIKLFAVAIISVIIGSIVGCADFPDEYAIEAKIEISVKDTVMLSEDGKNVKSAVLVHFDIEKNTTNQITSAIVTVQGVDYDVTDQLNPSVGGVVEIPYTVEYYNTSVTVDATLDILGHEYYASERVKNDLSNLANITTGTATSITPCSAVLNTEVRYPWLVNTSASYWIFVSPDFSNDYSQLANQFFSMLVNQASAQYGSIDIGINYVLSSLSAFDYLYGSYPFSVFRCSYSNSKMKCTATGLAQNTKYNYQLIRLDRVGNGVQVVYASDVKSFNTEISTASLSTNCSDVYYNCLTLNVSLDKGNTSECVSSSGVAKLYFYFGESESSLVLKSTADAYKQDSFVFQINDLKDNSKYYYKIEYLIGNRILSTTGIQSVTTLKLGEAKDNGHEWVNLGLPSGLKWATMNVGANTAEGSGNYYAWGETAPKMIYDYSTYKWCNGTETSINKYKPAKGQDVNLELEDDAAHVNWGGNWRMPTLNEWNELAVYCTWKSETQQGISGYTITSKSNGNSIFLPDAGYYSGSSLKETNRRYYWTSTGYSNNSGDYGAWCYHWWSSSNSKVGHARCDGLTVRAVCP